MLGILANECEVILHPLIPSSKRWLYLNIYVIGEGELCKYNPRCRVAFIIENNKLTSKLNIIENWIAIPTFFHLNERHFQSTSPNELILIGIDKQISKVQVLQILVCYFKLSPT
jgi:hypothetical protein